VIPTTTLTTDALLIIHNLTLRIQHALNTIQQPDVYKMVQQQRLTSIGISPSSDWLEACLKYLQQQNQTADEDSILHQILNTDLRDVVRCVGGDVDVEFDGDGDGDGDVKVEPPATDSPSILRDAIIASKKENKRESNNSCKSKLPESFRCMVQIEELLDVSMNAEQRLTLGPTSSSSPTPIGNQNKRCLKMLMSDGYSSDGRRNFNSDDIGTQIHVVAMETEPIPSLSVHSKPGIKVILSGPIVIRFGILMLDQSNTTVLGGCIPELIPIQKKAMDLAAKLAGVGIDPTFRALVWNPDTGMEDDQDEGEGESGDIQSRVVAMPINPPSRPSVEIIASNPIRNRVAGSGSGSGGGSDSLSNAAGISEICAHTQFSAASGTSMSSTATNPYHRKHRTQQNRNEQQNSIRTHTQTHTPSTNTSTASSAITPGHVTNPYSKRQDAPSSSDSTNTKSDSTPLNSQTLASVSTSVRNPYTKHYTPSEMNTHSVQQNHRSENGARKTPLHVTSKSIDLTSPDVINRESVEIENIKPNNNGNGISNDTHMNMNQPTSTPRPSSSSSTTAFQNLSPTALSEPLSFSELRMVLNKIALDADEYKRYEKRAFIVPCRVSNKKHDFKGFTIEKNKNYKKKSNTQKVSPENESKSLIIYNDAKQCDVSPNERRLRDYKIPWCFLFNCK